jgi:hypothetical protein
MSEMGNKEKKAKVDDDGDISVGDNSVHFEGEKSWYNKHGYNDATGKLWWDQHDELAEMERHEELLDIEKLKPTTDPVLWRIRKLRPYQKVPGSSIVNDTESRWVQCIRQDEEWLNGAVTIFSDLPRNLVEKIFIMAIERPSAHNSIARSCKEFTLICEDRLVVAHTAAVSTSSARSAKQDAAENAEKARIHANAKKAKVIRFDPGEWRGQRSKAKQPSGFGVYSDETKRSWFAGKWIKGLETGPCEIKYDDRSSYAGDVEKGKRHGNGVQLVGHGVRYEGSWESDRRNGYGITFGGYWPFMFGLYESGEPVGVHIAWSANTDTVLISY